jgi:hypothetical protein
MVLEDCLSQIDLKKFKELDLDNLEEDPKEELYDCSLDLNKMLTQENTIDEHHI